MKKQVYNEIETCSSLPYSLDKMMIVNKINTVPIQSIHPKATLKNTTDVIAADKGSAQASKLVSDGVKYFKLSK